MAAIAPHRFSWGDYKRTVRPNRTWLYRQSDGIRPPNLYQTISWLTQQFLYRKEYTSLENQRLPDDVEKYS